MFKAWQPRAFDLYLDEGFRDRPDGQIELKCRPDVEATIFATSGDLDIYAAARQIEAPVLLVRAGRGSLPAQAFEYLCRQLPRCTLLVPDIGHLLPLEAPELTAQLLEHFAAMPVGDSISADGGRASSA